MEEKELKTSTGQRIVIALIAVIMLGSIVASYAAIVISGNASSTGTSSDGTISDEKRQQYSDDYEAKLAELAEVTESDYNRFIKYKGEVKAYNETSANDGGVVTRDLREGSGRELTEGDYDYLAYYVGWCADETVFDTSLDDFDEPTQFASVISAANGLIEGWNIGVEGMKLGGVREITIPGELAYGEQMEICGGYNKPLKFIVMAVADEDPLATLMEELELAYMRWQYANYYGVDYDTYF